MAARGLLAQPTSGCRTPTLKVITNPQPPTSPTPQAAVGVLHVAQYYGAPRLTHLCEVMLGRVLKSKAKARKAQAVSDEEGEEEDDGGWRGFLLGCPEVLGLGAGGRATEGSKEPWWEGLSRDSFLRTAAHWQGRAVGQGREAPGSWGRLREQGRPQRAGRSGRAARRRARA